MLQTLQIWERFPVLPLTFWIPKGQTWVFKNAFWISGCAAKLKTCRHLLIALLWAGIKKETSPTNSKSCQILCATVHQWSKPAPSYVPFAVNHKIPKTNLTRWQMQVFADCSYTHCCYWLGSFGAVVSVFPLSSLFSSHNITWGKPSEAD